MAKVEWDRMMFKLERPSDNTREEKAEKNDRKRVTMPEMATSDWCADQSVDQKEWTKATS